MKVVMKVDLMAVMSVVKTVVMRAEMMAD